MVRIQFEIELKPVLKSGGKSLMGEGRAKLLRQIKELGSLSKAARQMGMSYRHAWGIIHRMEQTCGEKIVKSVRGGSERGQSVLTGTGERMLAEYEGVMSAIHGAKGKTYRKPNLTADGILVSTGKLLLVRRKNDPFKGRYALPGGFVEYGETVEECVVREVAEETGLKTRVESLLGVYSSPDRDPRGHTVSSVFILSAAGGSLSDSDETIAEWVPMDKLPDLAFDHDSIMSDYAKTLRKSR